MTPTAETTTEQILFDADAEQRFTYEITDGEVKYEITQVYRGLPDEQLAEYDRLREVSVDTNGANTDVMTDSMSADDYLFRELCTDVLGFDGDKPDNWQDLIEYDEKKAGINKLLSIKIVSDNTEKQVQPRQWGKAIASEKVELTALFDGRIVTTKAHFGAKTPADVAAYGVIKNRVSLIERGLDESAIKIPASMKRKADLFDRINPRVEGYRGRVPLHHKAAFVTGFFESKIASTEKK
ncbi:MAG: hypothetical protein JSS81_05825 [Acidobacteria bacterium]|nr:hypothetical protein [Acidobacteriota bacterium]